MSQPKEEPLKRLGRMIRSAREQRSLTLFELSNEARVSIEHIKSIEIGARKTLPEDTYLLGYLIKLLKALDFENADKLVEQYKKEEGQHIVETIVNSYESNVINKGLQLSDFKIYHLYIIFTLALFIISWFTVRHSSESFLPSGIGEVIKPGHILEPPVKKYDLDIMAQNGADLNGRLMSSSGLGSKVIEIEITEPVWYQIIGLGQKKVLFEGYIAKSEAPKRFKFMDDLGFVISTGNAGAIVAKTEKSSARIGLRGENIRWFYPAELSDASLANPGAPSTSDNSLLNSTSMNTRVHEASGSVGLQGQALVHVAQSSTATVPAIVAKPKVTESTVNAGLDPNPFVKKVIPVQQLRSGSEVNSQKKIEEEPKKEKRGWFGRRKKDKKSERLKD